MRTRIVIAATTLVAVGLVALLGGVLDRSPSAPATALAGPQSIEDFKAGFGLAGSTTGLVLQLQSRLGVAPKDEHTWALLGHAYQQRARETGDPSYYTKSEGALHRALALDPRDELVYAGLGSLALSRHRFREALALGEKGRSLNPDDARSYGVIGDAEVELGRYTRAFADFDRMTRLRPSLSSYARVSYGRELLGRTADAIEAMKLAVDAATDTAEPTAWTRVQLGKLYFSHGRYADAEREYVLANAAFPGYAYGLDAWAQDEAALGHRRRAVALERRAVDLIPLPQYVAALGDLYRATGRPALARRQYSLIAAIFRLLNANGVETGVSEALFGADHGTRLGPAALERVRRAHDERPSVERDDAFAWILARNGHCREALHYSQHALRLGTQDALKFFHRGMIERCLGHLRAGRAWLRRALALNPRFSVLWSPVARRRLAA